MLLRTSAGTITLIREGRTSDAGKKAKLDKKMRKTDAVVRTVSAVLGVKGTRSLQLPKGSEALSFSK